MRSRPTSKPIGQPPRGLTKPVPVDPTGRNGPTKSQAHRAGRAGARWRRSSPGRYVPAEVDGSVPEQRALEGHALLRGRGALTGWAALRVQGANFCDGIAADGRTLLPVDLVLGPGGHRRSRPGVRWSQDRLPDSEVIVRLGMRLAAAERATFDAMRFAPDVREAVVALEMAIAAELTSLNRMADYVAAHAGWDGVVQVRAAVALGCEHSRSPAETRMRLVWEIDAGLPRPLVNQEIFSLEGRLLAVADLLDPEAGVVGEYDGEVHAGARQRSGDATRESRLRDHGLEVFRVTGFDMLDVANVVRRMHAARERAGWPSPTARAWTITPPAGWTQSPSVDHVLALREMHRAMHDPCGPDARH